MQNRKFPVKRGMRKGEIVDELRASATDFLDDNELVSMDPGFDSEASNNNAEKHESLYANRKSRDTDAKKRMREMCDSGWPPTGGTGGAS